MGMQGRRKMNRESTEEFYGRENTRYAITMMGIVITHLYKLIQSKKYQEEALK